MSAQLAAAGWPLAWLSVALLALAVLSSVLSAVIERSGPIRLRHWAEEAGGRLRGLYEQPARFEAYRLLLSALAKVLPVGLFWSLALLFGAAGLAPTAVAAGLEAVVVLGVVVFATEMLNRFLVGWDPERSLERLTFLYGAVRWLLAPAVAVTVALFPARGVGRRVEDEEDEVSEDEIQAFIDMGTREGILEPGEEELLRGIVDFGDTPVRSVMVPRIQVRGAPAESSLERLADLFVESGHSRLPLYEGSIDHVVGILHIRDLLSGLRRARVPEDGKPPAARELANPPYFVPETKPLGQLLKELQTRFQQMAVVVDEYGGTAGVVTAEDLVEEIVGELVDEHEEAPLESEFLPDGAWLLKGSSPVELLEELFGVEIEEDAPWETVGGMVFSLLGDLPEVGESVESHGLRYTVHEVEERRIVRVRVEPVVTSPPAAGGQAQEAGRGEGT